MNPILELPIENSLPMSGTINVILSLPTKSAAEFTFSAFEIIDFNFL